MAQNGYYTEGNIVNGVNVGGGQFTQNDPPATGGSLNGQALLPPTQSYDIGNGDRTTDYQSYLNYKNTGRLDGNTAMNPSGQVTVPGVGQMSPQSAQKYNSTGQQTLTPPVNPLAAPQTAPQNSQNQPSTPQSTTIQPPNSAPDLTPKYQAGLNTLNAAGTTAPPSGGEARPAVTEATSSYQPPQQQYQPTPAFMSVGDPIMQTYTQAAMAYQNDVISTGYTAKALQATLANQVQNVDLQAANIQNIMNGTRDDIRAEISKAGGFATESQVEGLVTTRNRDLLKQYNNIELQKQTMQNQMQLQVGLAQADHQYAVDKFDNVIKSYDMYKGIYDNATNQVDKLVQNVGYQGLASAYNNDPYALSIAEKHLSMPQGTLSNPQQLSSLETYRQKTLSLSNARFGATYGYSPGNTPVTNNYYSSDASYNGGGSTSNLPGGGDHPQTNPNVSYEQYGLLSHTNFDPKNSNDQTALNYLNKYLNDGSIPNATGIGLRGTGNIVSQKFQAATTRANDLYFAATGDNLPAPGIIKNNQTLINANNQLANQLKIQENTVNANFGLSLQNLTTNNLNNAYPILNGTINAIKNAEGDPNVAQYMAQNSTIQQELGNLLAVKNASGTTVYDKIAGAGLMPRNATPQQQVQIVKTLLSEAKNASNAFNQANGELYKSIDPLERQKENPNRQSTINAQVPDSWVTMTGPKGTFKVDPKNVDIMKQNGYK